ncbi:Rnase Y domain-containing protein [Exiguobacterium sp.]|uniref:Rnase Y domain-containing protein n=1 Tax=Exiguobacterium sp. TaxID=44751 RepID=UPI0028A7D2AA|nr:Rnase Y domain-containing protein [Exiguobacterium sp.]
MSTLTWIVILLLTLLIAFIVGYFLRKSIAEAKIQGAETEANKIVERARESAEATKKEAVLEAKDEAFKLRNEVEKELRERRQELAKQEARLLQKEETLDRRVDAIDRKEDQINTRDAEIAKRKHQAEELERKVEDLYEQGRQELVRVANLSQDEARTIIMDETKQAALHDAAILQKEIEQKAKEEADKKARNILSLAIQRFAAERIAETTVSVVN